MRDHPDVANAIRRTLPSRSRDDRMVAGVCAGLAEATGVDPVVVRVATVVLAVTGVGLILYAVAWVVMPAQADSRSSIADPRVETRRTLGVVLTVLGSVLVVRQLGAAPPDGVLWPVLLVGLGLGVALWQVHPGAGTDRLAALRVAAGVVVVGGGVGALIAANVGFSVIRDGLLATALVVGGLALILGPWIAVLARDRSEERRRRIRADERAQVAAHLHDSVLQTFALIQRTDDPRRMTALARRQERELRRWLYGAARGASVSSLAAAIEALAASVEDLHGVTIEVVTVGDAPLTPTLDALVAAAGEAMTNAAKWSGEVRLSVYVEVAPARVEAFVRDTGRGFDLEAVDPDRLGICESMRGRMGRAGGECEILTAPGQGTEVRLVVDRS